METSSQKYTISCNFNFCLQLAYRILQKQVQEGSNFVSSPLSLHIVLSLVAAGSTGETLKQLLSFLGSESLDDLNYVSSQIVSGLRNVKGIETGGPLVSFINGAWVEKTFGLKTSFEDIVKNVHRSQIELVDFTNKAEEVTQELNSWVENATSGLIREIFTSGSLNQEAKLVLANALYFKGAWDQKFDPTMTRSRSFNLVNGQTVEVPFMTSKRYEEYHYRSFENYTILTIPYQNGNNSLKFAMYFFLPHEKDGLPSLIHTISSNPRFLNQKFELWKENIPEFWIPRFKFSFNLEATEGLRELGLTLPFTPGELTEVSDSSYSHKLYVSSILQKTFVEVNEEGTEAAASTAAAFWFLSATWPTPSFVADHPFMFMIREETSMAVFFIGAVLNPLLDS